MAVDPAVTRAPRWPREVLGALAALSIAITVTAAVAAGPRSVLLFRDGDSLVTTLVARSLAVGQPQDWAMSTVLFLPESALVVLLSLLGLGVAGTLATAAIVTLLALYGALRLAAGAAGADRAPIAGALLAMSGFGVLAITESSPSRDALEPASLLLTTTYYSATVIASVLAVGLVRRALDRPGRRWPVWALAAVGAASVLTNPLFAAWAVVPVVTVLAVAAWRGGAARRRTAVRLITALVGGSVAGLVLRLPLAGMIANTGVGYADPSRLLESAGYYASLLGERASTLVGVLGLTLGFALWAWCVAATVLLVRRGDVGAAVVAACGWVMPVLVVVGAVVLGTHAARYLQPIGFAPVLGLAVLPALLPHRAARPLGLPALTGATAVALLLASAVGIPRLASAANAPDADLDCVVEWTDAASRTGAGQFWTVRLAKAHLDDPRGLVQVDHELRGYAWLVNRDDFRVDDVSFLVIDDQSVPFALPDGASLDDAELIDCGRYTIADFGERTLTLGPQRS